MSLNTKKMIIGVLLSGLFMINASKVLSKDIVTVLPEAGQFFFEELRDIPSMPNPLMSADGYRPCKTNPAESEFAQQIEAMGWAILSEVTLGEFDLVTFAGNLTQGTSGMCRIFSSYIGIFDGEEFIGVVRAADEQDTHIGWMGFIQDGVVRLSSGDFISTPIADIRVIDDTLTFGPVSDFTSHCGGQSVVPNVIGQSIIQGRKVLLSYGFQPTKTDPGDWGREGGLYAQGISEVVGCSQGPAYCLFRYEDEYSRVSVVTQGEQEFPNVLRFWVDCKTE